MRMIASIEELGNFVSNRNGGVISLNELLPMLGGDALRFVDDLKSNQPTFTEDFKFYAERNRRGDFEPRLTVDIRSAWLATESLRELRELEVNDGLSHCPDQPTGA